MEKGLIAPGTDNSSIHILDWTRGELRAGLACYEAQQFFEAHEHWEVVWLRCAEPEKTLLQAIIQVTASFHHFQRGNTRGARSLLGAALRRLEPYPREQAGVDVELLRKQIIECIAALENPASPNPPAFPKIIQAS